MLTMERREAIMAVLEKEKAVTVTSLARRLYVSEATLRRDLKILEEEGRLRRSRGGAALPRERARDIPLMARRQERSQEKGRIAKAAAGFIAPGDTLFLDASTTVLALAEELEAVTSLTVLTSGLLTAQAFAAPGRLVLLAGGALREGAASVTGEEAGAFIANHHGAWCVLSCRGLTGEGLWESAPEEAALKRRLMAACDRTMLLCDSSKMNRAFLCRTAPLKGIALLVTDAPIPEPMARALKEAGVRVVAVP